MKKIFALLLLIPMLAFAANPPSTLLQMAGVHKTPGTLADSVLIIIDAQQEYVNGALPLVGIDQALVQGERLLARARDADTPIVHVVHRGKGALFNTDGPYFAIAKPLLPRAGEMVVEKQLPDAFAGTRLQQVLAATGRKHLVVIGFMTHMCVSSTVRSALALDYSTTVVAGATATRDLPDGHGGIVSADQVQRASLAALADRFAVVVDGADDIR